jgi:hypothetical protein
MIIISTLPIGATATTINFSLTTDSELAGQSELETEFVDKEVEKSNKSILIMKKQDFLPVGVSNLPIDKITYIRFKWRYKLFWYWIHK